jgi:hypothetical protein
VPRRTLRYLLTLAFFGLTPEHRKYVFDQIHQITFNGQGGYSFTEVYELPIHIRKYVFHQIKEHYDKQNKQNENPEELAKKIKGGQIEVPDYSKGKKLSYK